MPQELPGFYYDDEKNRYFPMKGAKAGASTLTRKPVSESGRENKSCRRTTFKTFNLLSNRELCGSVIPFHATKYNFREEYQKMQITKPVVWKYNGTNMISDGALAHAHVDLLTSQGQDTGSFLLAGGAKRCFRITTLGSGRSGGSVFVLRVSNELDTDAHDVMDANLYAVASFNRTIWTADYNAGCTQAAVGSDIGAAIIDLETGRSKWVFRCKSDVLSLQFENKENVIFCGLRNGAIITVDVRQRQRSSSKFDTHIIPYTPCCGHNLSKETVLHSTTRWFKLRGDLLPSRTVFMPSSVVCLECLQVNDQYFVASSMDGSIRLYDNRNTQKGPVQSYDGHVNSHTNIRFGVDPSERFLMSGGEDCHLRIWSIKSGQLLFDDNVSDSVISAVSWENTEHCSRLGWEVEESRNIWTAWLGSREGLFQMHWPETS